MFGVSKRPLAGIFEKSIKCVYSIAGVRCAWFMLSITLKRISKCLRAIFAKDTFAKDDHYARHMASFPFDETRLRYGL